MPESVRDRLAAVGYGVCPPDLRGRLDGWDGLDEADAAAALNDIGLLAAVLAR